MKTISLFKLIRLPEDAGQIASITDLLKQSFSLTSLEANGQPVYEDKPDYEFNIRFTQNTDHHTAVASIIFMDSMILFMIIVSMKGPAGDEPFTGAFEWDSIQRFESEPNGQGTPA